MAQIEKDALTGTETTGHTWDGIKELNTPLPRWWVWTFWATVIWSVGYWVVYPAWPIGQDYTRGIWGYSSRAALHEELDKVKQSRSGWLGKFEAASVEDIAKDSDLLNYAMVGGKFIFNENCAPCHGSGGQGNTGYPVLADDDWLWGGTLDAIYETVKYGVRAAHDDSRSNEMPAFGADELLTPAQIDDMAGYVMALAGEGTPSETGKVLFEEQCAACHGEDGKGLAEMGGPNLTDGIWLYGSASKEGIVAQLNKPKHGMMPAWVDRLDDVSIKQVTVYVHTLGGGQ